MERQADAAATRLQAGHSDLASGLGTVAAAAAGPTTSVGAPLEPLVRARMEAGFGIDMRPVRLHTDHPARRATAGMGLRAFASGVHIFLDRPLDPRAGSADEWLLAHEVAHVVQQARRRTADGGFSLRDVRGTGPVQAKPKLVDNTSPAPDIDAIAKLHKKYTDAANDPWVDATAASAKPIFAGVKFTKALVDEFTTKGTVQGVSATSLHVDKWRFVIDVFKHWGYDSAAAQLLLVKPKEWGWTALLSNDAYEAWLKTRSDAELDDVPGWLTSIKGMKSFTPAWQADLTMQFVVGTSRSIVGGIGLDKALSPHHIQGGASPTDLMYSEPMQAGMRALRNLEAKRMKLVPKLAQEVLGESGLARAQSQAKLIHGRQSRWIEMLTIAERIEVGEKILEWARKAAKATTTPDRMTAAFYRAYAERLEYYEPLLKLGGGKPGVLSGLAKFDISHSLVAKHGPILAASTPGKALHDAIKPTLDSLFELDATVLPPHEIQLDSDTYTTRWKAYVKALRKATTEHLELKFVGRLATYYEHFGEPVKNKDGLDFALEIRLLSLIQFTKLFEDAIDFDHSADATAERTYYSLSDVNGVFGKPVKGTGWARFKSRLSIAAQLLPVAKWLGWDDIVKQAEAVVAQGFGSLYPVSMTALDGTWKLDPKAGLSKLTEEFGGKIAGMEPFKGHDLYLFYQEAYWEELTSKVDGYLATHAKKLDNPKPIMTMAHEAAQAFQKPTRMYNTDVARVIKHDDVVANRQADLITSHPKHKDASAHVSKLGFVIWPQRVPASPEAIGWAVPNIVEFAKNLRKLAPLNAVIIAWRKHQKGEQSKTHKAAVDEAIAKGDPQPQAPTPIDVPAAKALMDGTTLNALEWVDALAEAMKNEDKLDATLVKKAMEALGAWREKRQTDPEKEKGTLYDQRRKLIEAGRRASIHDRKKLVDQQLRPDMAQYNPWHALGKTSDGRFITFLAHDIRADIVRFSGRVTPSSDSDFHMAAILLDMVDVLPNLIGASSTQGTLPDPKKIKGRNTLPFDLIQDWIGLLQLVPKLVSGDLEHVVRKDGVTTKVKAKDDKDRHPDWKKSRKLILGPYDATMTQRLAIIEKIVSEMKRASKNVSDQFGMRGIPADSAGKARLAPVGRGAPIREGETFTIHGEVWTFQELHAPFRFHPKHGKALESRIELWDDTTSTWKAADRTKKVVLVEVTRNRNPKAKQQKVEKLIITTLSADDQNLHDLSHAVELEGIVRNMQALADAINAFAELLLEGLEFIPGVGQAVMAARLFGFIMEFINGGEMTQLLELLTKDPKELLESLSKGFEDALKPEKLWEALLFGDNPFDQIGKKHDKRSTAKDPKIRGTRKSKKLKRLINRIFGLSVHVAGALGRMQQRVRWKTESVQMWVAQHALVGAALALVVRYLPLILAYADKAADHSEELKALKAMLLGTPIGDQDAADAKQDALQMKDFPSQILDITSGLSELELPAELIDGGQLVDIVIDIAVDRLGAKYEVAATVVIALLRFFDYWDQITQKIGSLVFSIANPNTLWQDWVQKEDGALVQGLTLGRRVLVTSLVDLLLKLPGLTKPQKDAFGAEREMVQSKTNLVKPKLAGTDFEHEVEGHGLHIGPVGRMPRFGGGTPLAQGLRSELETDFDQDFRHVRLHSGSDGAAVTRSLGVDGATSGSHVFLRPDLDPTSSHGDFILRHELTHVVQQTGDRAPGGGHSTSPLRGRPGRGVVRDERREAAADQMARATQGRGERPELDTPHTPGFEAAGLSQALLKRIVANLTSPTDIASDAETADKTGEGVGVKHLPKPLRDQASSLWTAILNKGFTYKPPFSAKTSLFEAHLTDNKDAIDAAMHDVALDAMAFHKTKKDSDGDRIRILDHDRLVAAFARYLFGRTGFVVHFVVSEPSGNPLKYSKTNITRAEVINVHLPLVGLEPSGLKIWQWATGRTGDDFKQALPRVWARLASVGIAPVWLRGKAKKPPNGYLKSRYGGEQAASATDASKAAQFLPANKLPKATRDEYLNPKGKVDPDHGYMGLGLATFSHAKKGDTQQGTERESHHITQYLLLEFFSNKHGTKAFPLTSAAAAYTRLGVKFVGTTTAVDTIDALQVGTPETGRGGGMPAILLSRPAHKHPRLHVTPKATDMGKSVKTQGAVVERWFTSELPTAYKTAQKAGAADFTTYAATAPKEVVSAAARKTYGRMRTHMHAGLKEALFTTERAYYHGLAHAAGKPRGASDWTISDSEIATVHREATAYNDEVMTALKWTPM